MASWWNGKWQIYINGKLVKLKVDKMTSRQNGKLMKCQFFKLKIWQKMGNLQKWQVGEMAIWWIGKLTKQRGTIFFYNHHPKGSLHKTKQYIQWLSKKPTDTVKTGWSLSYKYFYDRNFLCNVKTENCKIITLYC